MCEVGAVLRWAVLFLAFAFVVLLIVFAVSVCACTFTTIRMSTFGVEYNFSQVRSQFAILLHAKTTAELAQLRSYNGKRR